MVPCGHLRIGRLNASASSMTPPIPAKARRQPIPSIRNLPANGNNPCPSAPPAVTTPVTSPRCCGNHSRDLLKLYSQKLERPLSRGFVLFYQFVTDEQGPTFDGLCLMP